MTLTLDGTAELQRVLTALGPRAIQASAGGLFRAGEAIMRDAKGLCPVDTGALKNSGHVELPTVEGPAVEVVLGFVAVGGIFVTQILPHIWPVFLIVVVGSALIFMARRRAGRDGLTHRATLLNKED